MDPFQFFLVSEQFGIPEDADGILGLAQGKTPRVSYLPEDYKVGPLILDVLMQAGHITEKAFSTSFTGRFGQSFVDFGPPREEEMSSKAEFVEIPVNKGFFYTAIPQGVKFGAISDGEEFALSGVQAVFTTGTSISMVPNSLSEAFFKRMLEGTEAYEENGIYYNNCGYDMKDLWFMFEEHWIQVRGQDLLTDISPA